VFGFGSVAYWMDASRFCSLHEKQIFPWNNVTMTSGIGPTYLKCAGRL